MAAFFFNFGNMKVNFLIVCCTIISVCASFAQDTTNHAPDINMGTGLYSRYIWRGHDYGNSPSIQPFVELAYKGYTLGVAGAYQVSGEGYQEFDMYASKEFGMIKLSVWDYFGYSDTLAFDFFNYQTGISNHQIECIAELDFGKFVPIKAIGGYNLLGADANHALYFELMYYSSIGKTGFEVFCGFTPSKGAYAKKAAVVNCGINLSRELQLFNSFNIPCSFSVICNPYEKIAYLVAGISL